MEGWVIKRNEEMRREETQKNEEKKKKGRYIICVFLLLIAPIKVTRLELGSQPFCSPWGRSSFSSVLYFDFVFASVSHLGRKEKKRRKRGEGRKGKRRKLWAKTRFNNCPRRCPRTSFLRNIIIIWYVPFDHCYWCCCCCCCCLLSVLPW